MSLEQAILDKVRQLPPDKQQAVLEFADTLMPAAAKRMPLRSPKGLWADLDISLSEADIRKARREVWKNFARDEF